PPDMILVSIIEKILDVRRKFKGFDLAFEDFCLLSAYHSTKNNDCFSDTQQVWTTRCTLLLFWGEPKVANNIGSSALDRTE
ncbi:MAG: hypothetical protein KJ573_06535, partial [Proteobacteria bacterium]|nr:hypothetical protein [Pseudomonadota bacterium]